MVKNGLSDEAVARRVLSGDKEAYGYFVDKYSDYIFNIALRYTRNRADAMEVSQDVFVKAYKSLGNVKDYSIIKRWFAKIAVNTGLNWSYRKKRSLPTTNTIDGYIEDKSSKDSSPWNYIDGERDEVRNAISGLPEKLRTIVIMKYMDECSYAEIAKRINVSKATVRSRLARAKQMIKSALVPGSGVSSSVQQTA